MPFEFVAQSIPEVKLVRAARFGDERGFFSETFRAQDFEAAGIPPLVQHNHSRSERGVLRGLHFQLRPRGLGKLVRCVRGRILDVAVDIRSGSPTFGEHVSVELTDHDSHMMWVPEGFAHGFATLSEVADVIYLQTDYWSPEHERSLRYNAVPIDWQMTHQEIKLSKKDREAPGLAEIETNFSYL